MKDYKLGINKLICPYCNEIVECDEYYENNQDTEIEIDCEKCGKEFSYTWEIGDIHFKSFR